MDFSNIDRLQQKLKTLRPLNETELRRLREQFMIENTYGRMGLFDRGCCLPITGNPFGEPKPLKDCTEVIADIIENYMKSTHLP